MKPETTFVLENAAWPALLVESPGIIRRTNSAALSAFGARVQGGNCPLASIWSDANTFSPEEYLLSAFDNEATLTELQLRSKSGFTDSFQTYICPVERSGHRYFVLQFVKDSAPKPKPKPVAQPTPVPASPPPVQAVASLPVLPPEPEKLPAVSPMSEAPVIRSMGDLGAETSSEGGTVHKQKVDSALQLTRTVALDFNNALTSILGHTSLVLSKMEAGHPWRNSLLEVEKAASKAAEIAHDLAEFSRQEKTTTNHTEGNLNELLRRAVELLKSSAPKNIEWKLHLESKLCAARFDEAKMQQALVKILENAVEAVGEAGRIVVLSRNRELEEPLVDGTAKLAAGSYVCIEVSDSGPGIAPELLPRIFEPFYTTKAGHRGLGLPWVYGIISNNGGSVAVISQPGKGMSVRLYLPATRKIIRDKQYRDDELRGDSTVLIVDDEDLLLTMGQMILSSYGYTVLTANNGQKALELARNADRPIHLVITDLVMPGMSGRELIEHLKATLPSVPIIRMTGYTHPGSKIPDDYLQKPFTSQVLLSKVKEILNDDLSS